MLRSLVLSCGLVCHLQESIITDLVKNSRYFAPEKRDDIAYIIKNINDVDMKYTYMCCECDTSWNMDV